MNKSPTVLKTHVAAGLQRHLCVFMVKSKLKFSAQVHARAKKAIEVMQEVGYDLSQHKSKSLSEIPGIEIMGCGEDK